MIFYQLGLIGLLFFLSACTNNSAAKDSTLDASSSTVAVQPPLFPNSVVSNDLDFIRPSDDNAFVCLSYQESRRAEMPHKSNSELFADDVMIFEAAYNDGKRLELWAHPEFGERQQALKTVQPVAEAIGTLPSFMRFNLNHVVVQVGDHTANAEDRGRFFVVYSRNVASRLATNDLNETVFHESVHATLDIPHAQSSAWRSAQRSDKNFITEYAAELPDREDMAESALFAWALIRHPGRLSASIEQQIRNLMPSRLAFFESFFSDAQVTGTLRPQCS